MKLDKDVVAAHPKKPICGIVMPISAIDGCVESHWLEVREILASAIDDAGFDGNIVSDADDVGIIHKRIIQNLYDNPLVVCDVSGKNPNVMFELGLRLAFDKPTIIVKDDKTPFSFDTSAIEHLEYPRDLRFTRIIEFKQKLTEKLVATYKKATTDPQYTTFLKHFGEFTVAKIDKKEIPGQEYIIDELRHLRTAIVRLEGTMLPREYSPVRIGRARSDISISVEGKSIQQEGDLMREVISHPAVNGGRVSPDGRTLHLELKPRSDMLKVLSDLKSVLPPGANITADQ
jgi:hypothetical protein